MILVVVWANSLLSSVSLSVFPRGKVMRRSIFVLAGAATMVGCASGNGQSIPIVKRHAGSVYGEDPIDPGPGGPNPIDPVSGLQIIGSVTATYTQDHVSMQGIGGTTDYGNSCTDPRMTGGSPKNWTSHTCLADIAAAAGAAEVFLEKAFAAFGPRLTAASAGAAFTDLEFTEALAVAMSTLTVAEILPLLAAAGLTGFLVWMVIRCNAPEPSN